MGGDKRKTGVTLDMTVIGSWNTQPGAEKEAEWVGGGWGGLGRHDSDW